VLKLVVRAGLRERRDTREKINALIQAQLNTEAALARIAETQVQMAEAEARMVEAQARLADSLAHTDGKLNALIDIVREDREGKG
jgi:predicted nucleic-acid-binding protein